MRHNKFIFRGLMIVFTLLTVAVLSSSTAAAGSTGPYNAGSGTNVPGAGTIDWQNPGEITSPGSPYAIATLTRYDRYSNYLQGTNYSFDIPAEAVITGIEVVINRMSSGSSPSIYDNVVSLVKAGENPGESVLVGDNKASTDQWTKTAFTNATYGSPTDLWGTTWTPSEINDPGFGVALAAYRQQMGNNLRDAMVDSMQITVYFTLRAASTSVDCGNGTPEVIYGNSITCVVTVSDDSSQTPTGTVEWTTNGSGSFNPASCTLVEESSGTASCDVVYTPTLVGVHLISANYSGDATYDPSSADQNVTVNKRPASVTPDAATKIYGDADPTLTGTLSGFLETDNVTAIYSRTPGESVAGSPYSISASLNPVEVLSNYDITYQTADFSITPRPITVTADAQSKVVGQPDPELTYTITSGTLAFSDQFTGELTREPGEQVGTYEILQGTLTLGANYELTYEHAYLTIYYAKIYIPLVLK